MTKGDNHQYSLKTKRNFLEETKKYFCLKCGNAKRFITVKQRKPDCSGDTIVTKKNFGDETSSSGTLAITVAYDSTADGMKTIIDAHGSLFKTTDTKACAANFC